MLLVDVSAGRPIFPDMASSLWQSFLARARLNLRETALIEAGVFMILEVATLDVRLGMGAEFEKAFAQAVEQEGRYLLLVKWETIEDHTEGFRGSKEYQQWRRLLHHFYDPFPTVEHYLPVELV
jgi:heme-degrading monooxygenase HmoA